MGTNIRLANKIDVTPIFLHRTLHIADYGRWASRYELLERTVSLELRDNEDSEPVVYREVNLENVAQGMSLLLTKKPADLMLTTRNRDFVASAILAHAKDHKVNQITPVQASCVMQLATIGKVIYG